MKFHVSFAKDSLGTAFISVFFLSKLIAYCGKRDDLAFISRVNMASGEYGQLWNTSKCYCKKISLVI